ncbi:hypothetical protein [Natronoglycomyces albus]|uniref:Uncharacterized protein n=1 Tax=Natronoglycomyces albus TaxID=2811108 RepID=A0A895XKU2_9ACTN|nr:hypothetical protein [Natronoglycomyces albus]QSB06341.1 hypothetical protein JQS30_05375 [Natronoglycomyces albus]
MATLTAVGLVWGYQTISLPKISGLGGAVEMLWFYPHFAACALMLISDSPMPDTESTASIRLRLLHGSLLFSLCALTTVLIAWLALVENGLHSPAQLIGGFYYWVALTMISRHLLGPNLGWVLPLVAVIPVTWWGFSVPTDTGLAWWVLPALPGNGATVAIGAGMVGLAWGMTMIDAHRWRHWRRWPNRRQTRV